MIRVLVVLVLLLPATANADMGKTQKTYNRLWQKASRFYGAQGQPAPLVNWTASQAYTADTTPGPGGIRMVNVGPWDQRALARNKASSLPWVMRHQSKSRARAMNQRRAMKNMLHEWAHIYQTPDILNNPDTSVRESDASHFARALALRILARKGKRQKVPLDTTQFGSNYGANPRTITWPSS